MYCMDVNASLKDSENFKKMAGGAPANVAATITRLGGEAALLGKVSQDSFGDFLIETLAQYQVDMSMVIRDDRTPTTMAFVSLTADGERDFQFNQGADKNVMMKDIPFERIKKTNVLHFGSATDLLPATDTRKTYLSLMEMANDENILVSFDPNFRHDLWKNENIADFIEMTNQLLAYTDFTKLSLEEMKLLTYETDITKGVKMLHSFGAKVVAVTMGKNGTVISDGVHQELIPSQYVKTIDSTGAGDAFVGAVLYQLSGYTHRLKDFFFMKDAVLFANKVGAQVCTKVGALSALPTRHSLV